jgi:hypothetical protein
MSTFEQGRHVNIMLHRSIRMVANLFNLSSTQEKHTLSSIHEF